MQFIILFGKRRWILLMRFQLERFIPCNIFEGERGRLGRERRKEQFVAFTLDRIGNLSIFHIDTGAGR